MEKLFVKDLKKFVDSHIVEYASAGNKRLYVTLHAGPNAERYIVEVGKIKKGFTNRSAAVHYFNSLD